METRYYQNEEDFQRLAKAMCEMFGIDVNRAKSLTVRLDCDRYITGTAEITPVAEPDDVIGVIKTCKFQIVPLPATDRKESGKA